MDIFNIIEDIEKNNINEFFLLASCEIGNIEILEWILNSDYKISIDLENNLPFQIACQNNNVDIAKYIYKKTNNAIINDNYIIYNIFTKKQTMQLLMIIIILYKMHLVKSIMN